MSNDWNYITPGFCEHAFEGYPEIINCVTSFTMLAIGLYGLYGSNLKPFITKVIYANFVVNWFGSFLFHYYGYRFYGNIDTVSMLFLSWSLVYVIWSSIFEQLPDRLAEFLDDTLALFTQSFLILSICSITVDGNVWDLDFGFLQAFVIPNIGNIVGMVLLAILTSGKLEKRMYVYLGVGLFFMIVAVVIWATTEPYCSSLHKGESPNGFTRVSHGLWHVFFTVGTHYFIQTVLYMQCVSYKKKVEVVSGDNCCTSSIGIVLPVIDSSETNAV